MVETLGGVVMINLVRNFFKGTLYEEDIDNISDETLDLATSTLTETEKFILQQDNEIEQAMEMCKVIHRCYDLEDGRSFIEDGELVLTNMSSITELPITLDLYRKLVEQGVNYIDELDEAMVTEEEASLLMAAICVEEEDQKARLAD